MSTQDRDEREAAAARLQHAMETGKSATGLPFALGVIVVMIALGLAASTGTAGTVVALIAGVVLLVAGGAHKSRSERRK